MTRTVMTTGFAGGHDFCFMESMRHSVLPTEVLFRCLSCILMIKSRTQDITGDGENEFFL